MAARSSARKIGARARAATVKAMPRKTNSLIGKRERLHWHNGADRPNFRPHGRRPLSTDRIIN
jgi:hypothetical protein